MSHSYKT